MFQVLSSLTFIMVDAGTFHWTVVDEENGDERLSEETTEGDGVEVKGWGRGGGVEGGGRGREREEGRMGGEDIGADFVEPHLCQNAFSCEKRENGASGGFQRGRRRELPVGAAAVGGEEGKDDQHSKHGK
ncbi:hypothetical protein LR48_Vigan05g140400 [Vigna angularis]|uniref:Uncharacterized protein n=1 Tax=Phaseolus angularis TaxID=3914 RepID=A0A0L9UML9_PHAAN|nr:hypothetical protein LR48_Vigan05g140400 [Vigna angularis]